MTTIAIILLSFAAGVLAAWAVTAARFWKRSGPAAPQPHRRARHVDI